MYYFWRILTLHRLLCISCSALQWAVRRPHWGRLFIMAQHNQNHNERQIENSERSCHVKSHISLISYSSSAVIWKHRKCLSLCLTTMCHVQQNNNGNEKHSEYTVMTSLDIHYDSSRADIVPLPCLKLQLLWGTFTCPVADRVKGTSN